MSVVAKSYRGNLADLTHIGHIAIVDHTGKIRYQYGNPKRVTFARSSAKPIQAIPVLESGACNKYALTDKEIAILCASHSGEPFHVDAVKTILLKAGLNDGYLQCGVHYPFADYVSEELRKNHLSPQSVHCNCSGKHAGMLITSKNSDEDLCTYYKSEHPVQQRIMKTISEVCDYDETQIITAIDGCGVPVHALPLYKLAHGFARLSKPEVFDTSREKAVRKITNVMTAYPEMIAGTGRICTDLMKICGDRLFAKSGAAAYYALGLKDQGIGMAFKIEDGNQNVLPAVVLETLHQLDIITSDELLKLEKYTLLQSKNHKSEIVGEIKTEFQLIKNE